MIEVLSPESHRLLTMPLYILFPVLVVISVGVYFLSSRLRHGHQRISKLPLPPGPPQLPVVGNLFNSPFYLRWLDHHKWNYVYGPISHYKVFGHSTIVLTSLEAAHELLNKRASNYSDRNLSYMVGELVSKGYNILFRQYDSGTRFQQRLHTNGLSPRAAVRYRPIQELESLQLLGDMLEQIKATPGESTREKQPNGLVPLNPHCDFQRAPASALHMIVWGYRLQKGKANYQEQMDFFNKCWTIKFLSGSPPLIDIFPWLQHIPYYINPWKLAAETYHESDGLHHMENYRNALRKPGFNMSKQMNITVDRLKSSTSDTELAWIAGTLTLANAETTVAILSWLVVAMITYPVYMHKVQAMLDEVVGNERMPVYADKAQLPYIDAMMEEVMRWRPILPAGMDHTAREEDEYMGFRIPKGATIVYSSWVIARDKNVFGPDADEFRPERWLEQEDLPRFAFGFGRRVCPGKNVGREGLWILFARLLWAFDMEAPSDPVTKKKKLIDPMAMPSFGATICPNPFEAVFKPRGKWVEHLVSTGLKDAESHVERLMADPDLLQGL
ncbi:cytochrome P450 [Colletotrichum cereale]|nr:cytochrome P450 [Colletotrichum cereale]